MAYKSANQNLGFNARPVMGFRETGPNVGTTGGVRHYLEFNGDPFHQRKYTSNQYGQITDIFDLFPEDAHFPRELPVGIDSNRIIWSEGQSFMADAHVISTFTAAGVGLQFIQIDVTGVKDSNIPAFSVNQILPAGTGETFTVTAIQPSPLANATQRLTLYPNRPHGLTVLATGSVDFPNGAYIADGGTAFSLSCEGSVNDYRTEVSWKFNELTWQHTEIRTSLAGKVNSVNYNSNAGPLYVPGKGGKTWEAWIDEGTKQSMMRLRKAKFNNTLYGGQLNESGYITSQQGNSLTRQVAPANRHHATEVDYAKPNFLIDAVTNMQYAGNGANQSSGQILAIANPSAYTAFQEGLRSANAQQIHWNQNVAHSFDSVLKNRVEGQRLYGAWHWNGIDILLVNNPYGTQRDLHALPALNHRRFPNSSILVDDLILFDTGRIMNMGPRFVMEETSEYKVGFFHHEQTGPDFWWGDLDTLVDHMGNLVPKGGRMASFDPNSTRKYIISYGAILQDPTGMAYYSAAN